MHNVFSSLVPGALGSERLRFTVEPAPIVAEDANRRRPAALTRAMKHVNPLSGMSLYRRAAMGRVRAERMRQRCCRKPKGLGSRSLGSVLLVAGMIAQPIKVGGPRRRTRSLPIRARCIYRLPL